MEKTRTVNFCQNKEPVDYNTAVIQMNYIVESIINGKMNELLWFLEHPPIYTGGTSAKKVDLLNHNLFPVIKTGRGGQYTYHGPGQRVVYVMLDLKNYKRDIRQYINKLQQWLINTLDKLNIHGKTNNDRIGIWVDQDNNYSVKENKVAAIGVRIKHWVSLHGISLNINPNLDHYKGIIACGINDHGITSLKEMGVKYPNQYIDNILKNEFEKIFQVKLHDTNIEINNTNIQKLNR